MRKKSHSFIDRRENSNRPVNIPSISEEVKEVKHIRLSDINVKNGESDSSANTLSANDMDSKSHSNSSLSTVPSKSNDSSFIELNELDLAEESANLYNQQRLSKNETASSSDENSSSDFFKKFESSFTGERRLSSDIARQDLDRINNHLEITKNNKEVASIRELNLSDSSMDASDQLAPNSSSDSLSGTEIDGNNTHVAIFPGIKRVNIADSEMSKPSVSTDNIFELKEDDSDKDLNDKFTPPSPLSSLFKRRQQRNKKSQKESFSANTTSTSDSDSPVDSNKDKHESSEFDLTSEQETNKKSVAKVAQKSTLEQKSDLKNDGYSKENNDISQLLNLLENGDMSSLSDSDLDRLSEYLNSDRTHESAFDSDDESSLTQTVDFLEPSSEADLLSYDEQELKNDKKFIRSEDLREGVLKHLRTKQANSDKLSEDQRTSDKSTTRRKFNFSGKKKSNLEADNEAALIDVNERKKRSSLSKYFKDFRQELFEPEINNESYENDENDDLPASPSVFDPAIISTDELNTDEPITHEQDSSEYKSPTIGQDTADTKSKSSDNKNDQARENNVDVDKLASIPDDKISSEADTIVSNDTSNNELDCREESTASSLDLDKGHNGQESINIPKLFKTKFAGIKSKLLNTISRDFEDSQEADSDINLNDQLSEILSASENASSTEAPLGNSVNLTQFNKNATAQDEAKALEDELSERKKFDELLEKDPEAAAAFIAEKMSKEYKDGLISSAVEDPYFRFSKMADRLTNKLKSEVNLIKEDLLKDKSEAYAKLDEAARQYLDEENKRLMEASSSDPAEDSENKDDLKLMDEIVKTYNEQSEEVNNIFTRVRKGEERLSISSSQLARHKNKFENSADSLALDSEILEDEYDDNYEDMESSNDVAKLEAEAVLDGLSPDVDSSEDEELKQEALRKKARREEFNHGLGSIVALIHDVIFKSQKPRITPGLSKQSIDRLRLRQKLRNESATLILLYAIALFVFTIFRQLLPESIVGAQSQNLVIYILSELLRQIFMLLIPALLVVYKLHVPLRRITGKRKLPATTLVISALTGMPLAIALSSFKRLIDITMNSGDEYIRSSSYLSYVTSSSLSDLLILLIVSAVLCSFCEEIFARGILMSGMLRSGRIYTGILLSSLVYALSSSDRYVIYAMAAGMLFAWLRFSLGSIYSSMASHLVFNASLILMTSKLSIFSKALNQSNSSIEVFAAILSGLVSTVILIVLIVYLNGEKQFINDNEHKEFPRFSREKSWSPVNRKFLISLGLILLLIIWNNHFNF